jgi:hypothetical protein
VPIPETAFDELEAAFAQRAVIDRLYRISSATAGPVHSWAERAYRLALVPPHSWPARAVHMVLARREGKEAFGR